MFSFRKNGTVSKHRWEGDNSAATQLTASLFPHAQKLTECSCLEKPLQEQAEPTPAAVHHSLAQT